MSEPDAVDAPLLDALARRRLVLVRTQDDRSVVTEHAGRRVVVVCTDRELLARWWGSRADVAGDLPVVHELSLREVLGLWAAPDVDLLVDPGPDGGVLVPVGPARQHLGLGPVVPEGVGDEPLPFVGFTTGRRGLQVPLVLLVAAVVLAVVAAGQGSPWFALGAVACLAAAAVIGRPALREVRAARRATRRLQQARRLGE